MTLDKNALLIGGVIVGAFLLLNLRKTSRAAVAAVGDIAGGAVEGAGDIIGIPATDKARCLEAKAKGIHSDVATYCPALEFAAWERDNLLDFFGIKNEGLGKP